MRNLCAKFTALSIILICISCSAHSKKNESSKRQNDTVTHVKEPTTPKDLAFRLNERIELGDYAIRVVKMIDNAPAPDEYTQPENGKKFIAIEVLYENKTTDKQLNFNPFDWKLIDNDGYNFEMDMNTAKEPALHDGTLNPKQKTRGWITFQTPKESKNFKVQFQPSWLSNDNIEIQLN